MVLQDQVELAICNKTLNELGSTMFIIRTPTKKQYSEIEELGLVSIKSKSTYKEWANENSVGKDDGIIALTISSESNGYRLYTAQLLTTKDAEYVASARYPVFMVKRGLGSVQANKELIAKINAILVY